MSITHLFLILLLVVVWGCNFVMIKIGLDGMPPIFLACARFFCTSIPAVFFLKLPEAPFSRVALYGFVIFALQSALFFIGMDLGIPAGLVSILMQVHVLFSLLFATFLFREKIYGLQIVGAFISFLGITYAGMHIGNSSSLLGFFAVIAGGLCWGIGNALSKTIGNVNMLSLVAWGSMAAWPPLLLLSLFLEGPEQILYSLQHLSYKSVGAILYLSYCSTLFGYGLWSWLIFRQPLSTVAPFSLLTPVIAMASAVIILQEPLQTWKIITAILVPGGLSINFLAPRLLKKRLSD